VKPVRLAPNLPPRQFDGGSAIAAFRGVPPVDRRAPEDWVASTTCLFGESQLGLTRLPDGEWLRDAIAADPEAYLGSAHATVWGNDPALLVKLLHAGQRLPVHAHPDNEFSRRHLDCPYGKTEAWVVLATEGSRPTVYLGFRDEVTGSELAGWVDAQDSDAMLAAMNEIPVAPGDAILVPAGLPHAIGEGVLVLELQEPTDFSVLLEWRGFDMDGPGTGHLGLGFDVALASVDRAAWSDDRLAGLRRTRPGATTGIDVYFPDEADPYFRAERLTPRSRLALEPGYSVLAVTAGNGELTTEWGGTLELRRGELILMPYGAGPAELRGPVEVVRCRPPDPAEAEER
jgi:mannose-6-phosphate isomerase